MTSAAGPDRSETGAGDAIRTWLVAATIVVALVAVAMRRSLRVVNADSLLSGLISTQHLTAYYWGQDRLANIVPVLAWPIRDVRWNHLFQTAVLAASFFLLAGAFVSFHATRVHRRPGHGAPPAALAVTGLLALAILDRTATYVLILEQQYAFSTLLFLVGVAWTVRASRWSRIAGAVAMVLSLAVIPSSALLAPAVVALRPGRQQWPTWVRTAGTAVVAFGVATIASKVLAPEYPPSAAYTSFSLARLGEGFPTMASNVGGSIRAVPAAIVGAACVGVLIARRAHLDRALRLTYAACPVVALSWLMLFSTNQWVEINGFQYRYAFVAYAAGLFVLAGAVTETCVWVAERTTVPSVRSAPLAALVAASGLVTVGAVVVVARTTVPAADQGAALAAEAERLGADVVVGDYWRVWPAVFADRAAGGDLLAAAPRAEVLRAEFDERIAADGTIDALCLDPDVSTCLAGLIAGSGSGWQIVDLGSDTPLVIRVTPVP